MSKAATRAPKDTKKASSKKDDKDGKKKKVKKVFTSYKGFIAKVMKAASKGKVTMSSKTAAIMDSFVKHQMDSIAQEAASIARNVGKKTLTSADVQTAVRVMLPTELSKTCVAEATRAVAALSS